MGIKGRLRRSGEEGQVLVLFALASLVLVGCMALAFDVGYLLTERREAQNAADAAALAGAADVIRGEPKAAAEAAATQYATLNGVSADSVDVEVDPNPKDGEVVVEVTQEVERFFLGAIYTGDWGVTARAVAEIHNDRYGDYGLVTFEEPGTKFNGNNEIKIIDGSAMTNDAVNANPSNSHKFVVDGSIDAVGPINNANGGWSAPNGMNSNLPPIDDPLASIDPPDPNDYDEQTPPCQAGCTWPPGVYRDGSATIKNGTVTFQTGGVYYFENFTLNFQNTNSRLEGTNVLVYFDEDSEFNPKNGEVSLTSSDSSLYPDGYDNVVFWFANCDHVIESSGNTEYYFEGIFYAPCTHLVFSGTPSTPVIDGQMLVGSVEMKGTGEIEIDYNDLVDIPVYEVFLVE